VKSNPEDKMTRTRGRHSERGYTLIEFIVVGAILATVASIAVFQLRPTWQDQQANAGMVQVKATLRQARETAIAQRRSILVQFVSTAAGTFCPPGSAINNCIELFQMVVTGSPPTATQATTPFLTIPIQANTLFGTVTGETDTPDAFGIPGSGGIYFGGISGGPSSGMLFQSDGTFTDGSGNPINGTVFLAVTNINNSARAVTVLGNTGRIRAWKNSTQGWFQ
jgi:prepilin-type N-terminal cleavage/methylation domain-containing protein